jgi:serine/threonine protein kinase
MHERRVLHRDLKPGNVFLGSVGSNGETQSADMVKIGDLGLGRLLSSQTEAAKTLCGTCVAPNRYTLFFNILVCREMPSQKSIPVTGYAELVSLKKKHPPFRHFFFFFFFFFLFIKLIGGFDSNHQLLF